MKTICFLCSVNFSQTQYKPSCHSKQDLVLEAVQQFHCWEFAEIHRRFKATVNFLRHYFCKLDCFTVIAVAVSAFNNLLALFNAHNHI